MSRGHVDSDTRLASVTHAGTTRPSHEPDAGLEPAPPVYKTGALPVELNRHVGDVQPVTVTIIVQSHDDVEQMDVDVPRTPVQPALSIEDAPVHPGPMSQALAEGPSSMVNPEDPHEAPPGVELRYHGLQPWA